MSGEWARLVNWDGSDEFLDLCNKALQEVQEVTAHRLAEKIRERARRIEELGASAIGPHAEGVATRRRAWSTAADLIDPEVNQ